jgi:hypothetical protein
MLMAGAVSLASCGPKSLDLPQEPIERAATCGVIAANSARAATTDIKADIPFEGIGRVLHYTLLGGSSGGSFSAQAATAVQNKMAELQNKIADAKWQELIPACKAAYPAAYATAVTLPADRFEAQLGCYELNDYLRSALEEKGVYAGELADFRELGTKLDASIGPGLKARAGADFTAQKAEKNKALAAITQAGSPVPVLRECKAKFG